MDQPQEHETRTTDADVAPTVFRHDQDTGEYSAAAARAVSINRPREELYAFWREVSNLASFMENIERIDVQDERRSHWVVKAPAGTRVEWDSVITEDTPGRRIAWSSTEGSQIRNSGWVEFSDGPTGRGAEVRAFISYDPPGGDLGRTFAKVMQKEPNIQARRDLRRFKQLMETGEIATSKAPDAAPRS